GGFCLAAAAGGAGIGGQVRLDIRRNRDRVPVHTQSFGGDDLHHRPLAATDLVAGANDRRGTVAVHLDGASSRLATRAVAALVGRHADAVEDARADFVG